MCHQNVVLHSVVIRIIRQINKCKLGGFILTFTGIICAFPILNASWMNFNEPFFLYDILYF